MSEDTKELLVKGIVGVISPMIGAGVSLTEVEAWLRIASLVVGIGVGVVSLVSIWRKKKE